MDSTALISSVLSMTQSAAANQRQIAVAVNAVKSEQAATATLIEAIQQAAAYGSSGQATGGGAVGANFAALA